MQTDMLSSSLVGLLALGASGENGVCHPPSWNRWNAYLNFGASKPSSEYRVHATFRNNASRPVRLYKVDTAFSSGQPIDPIGLTETILPVGSSQKVDCVIGDTFTARALSDTGEAGSILMAHEVSRLHVSDISGECAVPLKRCQRKPFAAGSRWTPPDSFMIANHRSEAVEVYYVDGDCEELVATIDPGRDHHLQSTLGHSFRLRRPESEESAIVLTYTLDEVTITDALDEEDEYFSNRAAMLFDKTHMRLLHESVIAHRTAIEELEKRIARAERESTHHSTQNATHPATCDDEEF